MGCLSQRLQGSGGASRLPQTFVLPFGAAMLAMTALVTPAAEFPLNDDWVYTEMVRELLAHHHFYAHPYRGSLAVTLTAWGGLVSWLFGWSYTVLRCSTLVLALVGVWATAKGALEQGLQRPLCLLCGAMLLANPVFLNLSYTFMSDVPFAAAAGAAGYCYVRALRRRSAWYAFWGSTWLALACATRQIGVLIAAAFLVAELVSWARGRERAQPRLLLGFAAPLLLGALLYVTDFGLPSGEIAYFWPTGAEKPSLLRSIPTLLSQAGAAIIYLGLFTLPIAFVKLAALAGGRTRRTWKQWLAFGSICVALQLAAVSTEGSRINIGRIPLLPNVLYDLGTGPVTLRDVYVLGAPKPVSIGGWWWVVHLLALASAALLLVDLLPWIARSLRGSREPANEDDRREAGALFLALWLAAMTMFPYFLFTRFLYDRYLLALLFPLTILAAGSLLPAERSALRWGWIGAGLIFAFSLAGVQDYLAWNGARWEAVDYLRSERGVGDLEIDGGFEYNGSYLSAEYRRRHGVTSFFDQGPGGFWLLDETAYSIFMNRPSGCGVGGRPGRTVAVKEFPYFSWLGMQTREIQVTRCDAIP